VKEPTSVNRQPPPASQLIQRLIYLAWPVLMSLISVMLAFLSVQFGSGIKPTIPQRTGINIQSILPDEISS
jgi:hypothetical protein